MNDSYVIAKVQCPKCKQLGRDRSHDNLAIYADGHKYCYSCGYTVHINKLDSFRIRNQQKSSEAIDLVCLPEDSTTDYPQRCLDWIHKYNLSKVDLLNHNVMWSESLQRLIFPIYGADDILLAWQGRSFSRGDSALTPVAKWYGKGNLKDTLKIIGTGNKVVLTEDIISAIKVSKVGVIAIPLFGCHIGTQRFQRLYSVFGSCTPVYIWLDPDKRKEAALESQTGGFVGLDTRVVLSEFDPKEHKFVQIAQRLGNLKEMEIG